MTAAVAKHLVSLLTQITIFSLYLSLTPIKQQCMFGIFLSSFFEPIGIKLEFFL